VGTTIAILSFMREFSTYVIILTTGCTNRHVAATTEFVSRFQYPLHSLHIGTAKWKWIISELVSRSFRVLWTRGWRIIDWMVGVCENVPLRPIFSFCKEWISKVFFKKIAGRDYFILYAFITRWSAANNKRRCLTTPSTTPLAFLMKIEFFNILVKQKLQIKVSKQKKALWKDFDSYRVGWVENSSIKFAGWAETITMAMSTNLKL